MGRLRDRRSALGVRRRRRTGPRGRQRLPRLHGPGGLPRRPGVRAGRAPPAAPVPRAPVPPRRQLITTAYLKASHRELDEERTTEGDPYHPHTRAVPVEPGRFEEYVLRVYPFGATFLPGHKLVVELSNDEPLADAHNALLPPDAFHLPVGRPVTHKIYRDAAHPSRIVLPFTRTVPSS
ncbi:CocE/NonD family hydrolase C-terminal non-catalytic domain-containing protein [Streptomyces sp. NPDC058378]|uniref:CocE/NonD family hydrolase C-terminal non-catalytic domain-containing protein n=1 Tax=Streptomyces sp. NPDC058378 TaxID=3346469 RepID=UPI00366061E6